MSRTRVKLRDRFLAALLSVLMIFAMIPVTTLQAFAATTEYPDHYTVTVTDGENPIAGATVTLTGKEDCLGFEMETTTDANGVAAFAATEMVSTFSTTALEEYVDFLITVVKAGYETATVNYSDFPATTALTTNSDVVMSVPASNTATVSVTVTGDATVEVNGAVQNSATVDVGTEVPVKITPADDSYIKTLTVGGETVSVTKGEAYEGTVKADADVAIVATVVKEFTVSAPAVEGGAITLNGGNNASLTVDENTKVTVGVTAADGYQISSVAIGGAAQTLESNTTFSKEITVTTNTEISVVFAKVYTVTVTHTIDHTIPVIAVSYDNNDVQNSNYYKAYRTATVVITEHNFNAERVTITHTATDDGAETTKPTISGWKTDGDKHTATIYYGKDAKYTFDIAVNDKAGNASADYTEETFFVDTTMPTLEITGVADQSANNGDVIPVVSYSDTNYDADKVTITLTGANRKSVELDGSYADIHNGRTFTFKNFAKEQAIDDIYTLTATLTDKAGNTTEKTITFSVNRFGSTYALSEAAEKLNGTYVKEPVDVVITETNADELSNIKITSANGLYPKAMDETYDRLRAVMASMEKSEKLGEVFCEQIATDDEKAQRVGYYLAKAILDDSIEDLLVAVCGWTSKSLLNIADFGTAYQREE